MYVNDEHYCLTLIPENSQNDDLQLEVSAVNSFESGDSKMSTMLISHDAVPLGNQIHPYSRTARSLAPTTVCSPGIGSRERGPESEPEIHPSLITLERLFG